MDVAMDVVAMDSSTINNIVGPNNYVLLQFFFGLIPPLIVQSF
jgi:hypothetical protein